MAEIKPFRGVRYKLDKPQDLGKLIAPPYDMIDAAMVDRLYEKDPLNAVRIMQNRPEPADTCNKDRHIRAAGIFRDWYSKGILKLDDAPSVYVYEQTFSTGGSEYVRTGVVVLAKLVDFEEGIVLPHEYTLSGPKQDRYELLDAARVNTGQIFGLISDKSGDIYSIIRSLKSDKPDGEITDENKVIHRLYRCTDMNKINSLIAASADQTILIADGHHRYETALKFYRDQNNPDYSHVMMTIVSMADPGLIIRPFHRLIRKDGQKNISFFDGLKTYLNFREIGPAQEKDISEFLNNKHSEGMLYLDSESQRLYSITLSEEGENLLKRVNPEHSMLWKHLDVAVINTIVINTVLNLPLDGKVLHDRVEYVNDFRDGIKQLVDKQSFYGGFFIKPVSIDTVQKIVSGGERMPQKSTNFFPKLYSGLVFNKLDK
jgi:uncharacterized protein (DUF1015 family)